MKFIYTNGCNTDFIQLCYLLDNYLNNLVGGEENRSQYIQYNSLEDIHDVVMAYDKKIPVVCASFKYYNDNTVEVKSFH